MTFQYIHNIIPKSRLWDMTPSVKTEQLSSNKLERIRVNEGVPTCFTSLRHKAPIAFNSTVSFFPPFSEMCFVLIWIFKFGFWLCSNTLYSLVWCVSVFDRLGQLRLRSLAMTSYSTDSLIHNNRRPNQFHVMSFPCHVIKINLDTGETQMISASLCPSRVSDIPNSHFMYSTTTPKAPHTPRDTPKQNFLEQCHWLSTVILFVETCLVYRDYIAKKLANPYLIVQMFTQAFRECWCGVSYMSIVI